MHDNANRSKIDQGHPELRRLRDAAGLSQQALAERAECAISTVALLERGYLPKRSSALARVLAVLTVEREP
jgi:transcriptional regulator with XRE-family HTH domain